MPKKTVFLVWEFQIVTIETTKVQLQVLRAIASTKKIGEIYKKTLEKLRNWQWRLDKDEIWFEVDECEIDHINGGGTKHRKQIGSHIYNWIKNNEFPEGFQVLCFNCNLAKGFYGVCPHNG